jgi:hypothetical protein
MKNHLKEVSKQLRISSDILMNCLLIGYFLIGLLLSPCNNTWRGSIGMGGLLLIMYYCSKLVFFGTNLYQYMASIAIGLFAALFIYQMGGMVEMHIFILIGSAFLIIYRNWKLQLPLAMIVILHYSVCAYYQFVNNKPCILQMNYANISILVLHCFFIVIIISFCGLLAHVIKTSEENYLIQEFRKRNTQQINQ